MKVIFFFHLLSYTRKMGSSLHVVLIYPPVDLENESSVQSSSSPFIHFSVCLVLSFSVRPVLSLSVRLSIETEGRIENARGNGMEG